MESLTNKKGLEFLRKYFVSFNSKVFFFFLMICFVGCGRSIVFEDEKDGSVSDAVISDAINDGIINDGVRLDGRLTDSIIPDVRIFDAIRLDIVKPKDIDIVKDTIWVDFIIPDSFDPDLLPCQPSCEDLCKFIYGCFPNQPLPTCQTICSNLSQSAQQCLAKAYCSNNNGAPQPPINVSSCEMIRDCIETPKEKPDLIITNFTAKVQVDTVFYEVEVCNSGKSKTGSFYIDVYYNRFSAPKINDFGDKYIIISGLSPQSCIVRTFNRSNTPPGKYSSWVQVDADNVVDEINETNNVAGPVGVSVKPQSKGPDLIVQSMSASVTGANNDVVRYKMEVCNIGNQNSGASSVELFYNRSNAPTIGLTGNQTIPIPALSSSLASQCTIVQADRTSTPVGNYQSWAIVDTKNSIKETNEFNNIHGPKKVSVTGLPPLTCSDVCNFGVKCNEFASDEMNICLTWCSGFTKDQFNCHVQAVTNKDCSALQNCDKPPKPCVAPPGYCPELCNYLTDSCNLPNNQWWTCIGACSNLCSDKIKCVENARKQNQCIQVLMCLNS